MNSGHWSRNFSSVDASVENPDLVFLTGTSARSSKRISRSCVGEFRLRSSWPATTRSSALSASTSSLRRGLMARRVAMSTPDTDVLHLRRAPARAGSRWCDTGRPSPARRGWPRSASAMWWTASASPSGALCVADPGSVEVELTGRGGAARRGEAGELVDQVGELVARLGRIDEIGRDRGVEPEPDDVDRRLEQRAQERLDVVTAQRRGAARGRRQPGVGEQVGREPSDLGGTGR